jgi:hypothetical protein
MSPRSKSVTVHHPSYPDGEGVLIAWAFSASAHTEQATYLLRGKHGYFVHYHRADGGVSDNVLLLSADEAEYLYGRFEAHLVSGKDAFG